MRAFFLAGSLGVALSGCADLPGAVTPPTPQLALLGGAVTAAVPQGYCIETRASRPRDGFAIMAACETIEGQAGRPVANGLITVQAGSQGSAVVGGSEPAFAAYLQTDGGRALLSQTGDASHIGILDARADNNRVTVAFTDTGAAAVAGLQPSEWRAFFDLNGRMLTVAVRGLAVAPLPDFAGRRLLDQAVSAIIAANTAQPPARDG